MKIIASAQSDSLVQGVEYQYTSANSGVISNANAILIPTITIDNCSVYSSVTFTGTYIPPGSTTTVGFTATITGDTEYTTGDYMSLVTVGQSASGDWGVVTIISPRVSTMEV